MLTFISGHYAPHPLNICVRLSSIYTLVSIYNLNTGTYLNLFLTEDKLPLTVAFFQIFITQGTYNTSAWSWCYAHNEYICDLTKKTWLLESENSYIAV